MRQYAIYGVTVEATVPLTLNEASPQERTIRISRASVARPERWDLERSEHGRAEIFLRAARVEGGYAIEVVGTGLFFVSDDGGAITFDSELGARLEHALFNIVIPQTLWLAGETCLHASAAWLEPLGVVAFVGPSRAGKSTLATALGREGRFFTDDCLRITCRSNSVDAWPGPGFARLRADAFERLTGRTPQRAKSPVALATPPMSAPIGAVYVLEPRPGPTAAHPLQGTAALEAILPHLHRLHPGANRSLARELHDLCVLTSTAPIFRLSTEHAWSGLPELVSQVREHATHHRRGEG